MSAVQEGFVRGFTQALTLLVTLMMLIFLVGVVVFALSFGVGAGMASAGAVESRPAQYVHLSGARDSRNKLLVVRVEGPILGAPPRDRASQFLFGGLTYGYDVQRLLEEAAERGEVKGVLLHLQTPGGTIFGSRAIHDGVKAYREKTKKPVVAYIEGLSASGGVMAMVGATRIFADHGSLIGSIGVLGPQLMFFNKPVATDGGLLESGIVTQNGIEQTVISAGRSKDLGNPFRRPTDEEIASLTRGVELEYVGFVQHVATHRGIDPATITERMGALIFDNATARELQLIDGTATRGESITTLAELAGVARDFQVVRPTDDEGALVRRLLMSWFQAPAADRAESARDALRAEFCSSVRAPLVYYGDPTVWCR